jgi:hypothetical protein
MIKHTILVMLLLAPCLPGKLLADTDPLLAVALADLTPGDHLLVTTAGGDNIPGFYAGTRQGELMLREPEGRIPLANVLRIRERINGAGTGWNTGFTTGAVVGGSVCLLWGLALSSLDSDDDNIMGIIGFTGTGIIAGGVGFGAIGAGLGALGSVWKVRYESPLAPVLDPPGSSRTGDTRLALGLGYASAREAEADFQTGGMYGQVGLQRPLGPHFSLGPEIAFYNVEGVILQHSHGYSYYDSFGPVLSIGLAGVLQPRGGGWAPYLVAGTGYYLGDGEFLGASFGAGLRYRTQGRQEFKLELRDHVNIYDDDALDFRLDHLLTVGAVLAFDL